MKNFPARGWKAHFFVIIIYFVCIVVAVYAPVHERDTVFRLKFSINLLSEICDDRETFRLFAQFSDYLAKLKIMTTTMEVRLA